MGARVSSQGRKRVSSRTSNTKPESQPPSSVFSTSSSTAPATFITSASSNQSSERIVRNGRQFHNPTKSTYWLPNDDEEMDRYIGQHFALKALFDGNIPKQVLDAISFDDEGVNVLDLGCGAGTWIMDVATEYPLTELIGVDMCDVFPSSIRPANVNFTLGNVVDGLEFPDNSFDMVHLRFFVCALRTNEWVTVLREIRRVLKPGGFVYSVEPGMLEVGSEFVMWAGKIFKDQVVESGQEPYIAFKMKECMETEGFEVISCIKKETYPGRSEHLSREFLWDLRCIFKGAQAFLSDKLGVSNEQYPQFLDALTTELQKQPESNWSMVATLGRKPL
ncbi:S-adenosyl-L-methionine-dependent methyltransferase [Backusella circina FSU 941]|nr:S-adenosyl-L-methionine-dependent methyltransferase [Backusella circina FSU 941]